MMGSRLLALLAAALLGLMVAAGAAPADGDPASDVLLNQDVFYPYSPAVSPAFESALNAETAAASRAGAPVKIALIESPADLGSVPELFGKPQQYADFLEQELVAVQGQQRPLLVVMASGLGIQGASAPVSSALATVQKPPGGRSDDLAQAAMGAVAKIAAADGHPIATPPAARTHGGGGGSTIPVSALAVAVALAAVVAVLLRRRTWTLRRSASASPEGRR
jgi:hypothetical protein